MGIAPVEADEAGEMIDGLDAFHRSLQARWIGDITGVGDNRQTIEGPAIVSDEHPNRASSRKECSNEGAANVAGRSSDQGGEHVDSS